MDRLRLLAGLGNPGAEYVHTRHNIGFIVVDRLVEQAGAKWERFGKADAAMAKVGELLIAKPLAFMNRSGQPLRAIADFYKIEAPDLLVILDDFALPVGRIRIRQNGSAGGHNGLDSVIMHFGTDEIARLRVGIGAAPARGSVDYVLGRFFEEEREEVARSVDRAVDAIKCTIDNGLVSAMNTFNQAEPS